jgi:hypothetical protein
MADRGQSPSVRRGIEFPHHSEDNKVFAEKKLTMPVPALGAEKSFGDQQAATMRDVGTHVEGGIAGSRHWYMEEQQAQTVSKLRAFLDGG